MAGDRCREKRERLFGVSSSSGTMAASQKFCLKWNNFQNSVTSVFDSLRQDEELVDITLCCEGRKIKAHRMMLSACSPYFRDLFKDNPCQHPLFFLKDTSYVDIAAVIEFVYKGEVNVLQSQLASFLKTAELLQVKGLSGDEEEDQVPRSQPPPAGRERPPDRSRLASGPPPPPPPVRQRPRESAEPPASPRLKRRRLSGSSGSRPGSPSAVSAAPPPPAAAAGPRDPAADVMAGPPDAALPPPPPPVSGADLAEPPPPQHEPPPQPAAGRQDYGIKVEKIDIADDDDDVSLEATLGQVSTFEASQFDGSDHSASSNDMAGLLSRVSEQGGGDLLAAGASGDDGASQGPFRCAECGAVYHHVNSYRCHVQMHRGRTQCHVCRRVFDRPTRLNEHLYWVHGVRGAYSPRGRAQRGAAGRGGHHPPHPPLPPPHADVCTQCGKQFTHRKSYLQHLHVHTGATTCSTCGVTFDRKTRLNTHVKLYHPELTRQPSHGSASSGGGGLPCPDCGKVYANSGSLSQHRRIHSGATLCRLCGTGLSRVAHLRRHLITCHRLSMEQALVVMRGDDT
ncbi:Broad-complex core protein isoform 6 [Amphibalanus amphitrite]|uniref:Broad-complex core protein isoform 6 n=1 Tax=Amphibalanus amphitrite TaxID=1232801 RepID=A0A6A4X2H7_AMPAM|nr:Broad-complex core protein isoform 6 [Amphibalanus amphitrite]